jgi:hypothetical protein
MTQGDVSRGGHNIVHIEAGTSGAGKAAAGDACYIQTLQWLLWTPAACAAGEAGMVQGMSASE